MDILGLNFSLDSAAALVRDGRTVAAAVEERFDRVKHSRAFPLRAMEYCLEAGGTTLGEVDGVAFFWNPALQLGRLLPRLSSSWRHHAEYLYALPNYLLSAAPPAAGEPPAPLMEQTIRLPGRDKPLKIHYVAHHLAHAASAFFPSPFSRAAILTVDGYGEGASALLGAGRGNKIEVFDEIPFPHSLGSFYAAVTEYLGFLPNCDEGKVMGLAPYGEPVFCEKMLRIVGGGRDPFDLSYFDYYREARHRFSPRFVKEFGPPRAPGTPLTARHKRIAASAQLALEEALLVMARRLYKLAGEPFLCLAGGVALNSVANGRILRETPFEDIYVQPAASDAGTSLGAALYVHHVVAGNRRRSRMLHDYLGPTYSAEEIEKTLRTAKLPYERSADVEAAAAGLLSRGRFVGWFQGGMEFGPRALGNRSILCDPRPKGAKDKLNRQVKRREPFRPFAPSVPLEKSEKYFEHRGEAPFMLKVAAVREERRGELPAVTHVDGTARLHTVRRKTNPRYYKLMERFEELTGTPVILNTSFNVKGEPIVRTPEDALRCFFTTGLDDLVLGDFIVSKGKGI